MHSLDPRSTALVLIDLQNGIVGMDLAPLGGPAVVDAARDLAAQFREAGAAVILVHVGWSADGGDLPPGKTDKGSLPPPGGVPEGWSDFVPGLREAGDLTVFKHQWGAFTGTDLDVQLRRRGVDTIVLAGIATNMGVESTARHAWELGYNVVLVEDVCSSRSEAMHRFAIDTILPLIARVVRAEDVALGTA